MSARTFNTNNQGEVLINVGLSEAEMRLLIEFIDDEEVDEDALLGIRRKLANRLKRLRKRVSA